MAGVVTQRAATAADREHPFSRELRDSEQHCLTAAAGIPREGSISRGYSWRCFYTKKLLACTLGEHLSCWFGPDCAAARS